MASTRSSNRKLLVLPGDGIGPEVMNEVRKVIAWTGKKRAVGFDIEEGKVGGAAIDAEGAPLSDATMLNALRRMGYAKDEMCTHGFRSIASTLLNELGYNRDWIERQLAHGERNDVLAAYNYAEYLPERRKMMQEWADYLTELKNK